ncbi:hypothetical protein TNCV_3712211 [Trichonephila clavipes]|nr:hypothetical protein TNCV_3712211 [Trichonephila clavipes]
MGQLGSNPRPPSCSRLGLSRSGCSRTLFGAREGLKEINRFHTADREGLQSSFGPERVRKRLVPFGTFRVQFWEKDHECLDGIVRGVG